jgi:hypothetical protein
MFSAKYIGEERISTYLKPKLPLLSKGNLHRKIHDTSKQ